ncbi:unnamed protein product [Malus baccata var. baccata]
MANKGASSSNPVATWNAHNISIFCDVCIKEVEVGHRELGKKKVDKKGKKIGGVAKLCGQIDRLVEAYETRSSANSLMRSLHIGSSISEVLAVVGQLPGCEPPSELWLFATCLFCSAEKREVFTMIQDPEVRLTWLKYMFNKEQ